MNKKVKTYRNPSVSITIRTPDNKGRKSFSLSKVIVNNQGIRSQTKMDLESVKSINSNFKSKLIDYNQAITLLEKIKETELKSLKEKLGFELNEKPIINESNQAIVTNYLNEEYSKRKNIKPVTHKHINQEMKSILNILGSDISLIKDDEDTIYYKIASNTQYSHENKRRLVCRVNSLLKFIGRDFKVSKLPEQQRRKIPHITEKELPRFIAELNREIDKVACRIFFYTGLRTGEMFAFELSDVDFKNNMINIDKQLTREFNLELPKCNKERDIIFPDHLLPDLEKWFEFDKEHRKNSRNGMGKRFLAASRRIWGKSKTRDISPHDLRRSYAIYLITEKEFSITDVAFLLGDNASVVQKYYSGYTVSSDMAKRLLKKLG